MADASMNGGDRRQTPDDDARPRRRMPPAGHVLGKQILRDGNGKITGVAENVWIKMSPASDPSGVTEADIAKCQDPASIGWVWQMLTIMKDGITNKVSKVREERAAELQQINAAFADTSLRTEAILRRLADLERDLAAAQTRAERINQLVDGTDRLAHRLDDLEREVVHAHALIQERE
jgi:hypothetical protein